MRIQTDGNRMIKVAFYDTKAYDKGAFDRLTFM